jgi:hypothetical protein
MLIFIEGFVLIIILYRLLELLLLFLPYLFQRIFFLEIVDTGSSRGLFGRVFSKVLEGELYLVFGREIARQDVIRET